MENLIITEKIDFYLSGKMSAEEQKAFEEQMSLDAELKREVDLQREVIRAIRKQALRDKVKTFEKKTRFKNLVRIITTALAPIAVAACVAGIVIVPQMQAVASLSEDTQLYSSATIEMIDAYSSLRGGDESSDVILNATELMQKNEFKQADMILCEGLKSLEKVTSDDIQAYSAKEDMLYLRVLCSIKEGKVYSTRNLLSQVVEMDITHKEAAQALLNKIKGE